MDKVKIKVGSDDANKEDNTVAATQPAVIKEPDIDMSKEIHMLDLMLNRVSVLVSLEESIDNSDNIARMCATACDIASSIKYLKSDVVIERGYSADHDINNYMDGGLQTLFLGDEE